MLVGDKESVVGSSILVWVGISSKWRYLAQNHAREPIVANSPQNLRIIDPGGLISNKKQTERRNTWINEAKVVSSTLNWRKSSCAYNSKLQILVIDWKKGSSQSHFFDYRIQQTGRSCAIVVLARTWVKYVHGSWSNFGNVESEDRPTGICPTMLVAGGKYRLAILIRLLSAVSSTSGVALAW